MNKHILIYGAGVIGCTYGGLLAKSGQHVSIFARNRRLTELQEKGLLLRRDKQNAIERINVEIISEIDQNTTFDFVLVAIRNEQVKLALPELQKINCSCFIFMVNNPLGYNEWANVLGEERILPAFPGTGGKIENAVLHYEIVSRFIQPTTLGELNAKKTERLKEIKRLLRKAGFPVSISKNMDSWQKNHVAMVTPLANVIYFDGGNNYTVAKNKVAIRQMALALKECFNFIKQSGIGIEPRKLNFFRILPARVLCFILKLVYNTKWAETVISNHAINAKHEMQLLTDDLIKLALAKGFELKELKRLTL